MKNANDGAWALPIGAIVLSLRHIGLSGYMQSECMALENEFMSWQQMGGFAHQDEARRLTSTLQRVLRLTESFSSMVVDSLYEPATLLGSALGVQEEKAMGTYLKEYEYGIFVQDVIIILIDVCSLLGIRDSKQCCISNIQACHLAAERSDAGCKHATLASYLPR